MIDPVCGMHVESSSPYRVRRGDEVLYFCSPRCADKFAKENDLVVSCHVGAAGKTGLVSNFFNRKITLVSLGFLVLLGLSYIWDGLYPFRQEFLMYFRTVWWAITIGFIIGGTIDFFLPSDFVSHVLAGKRKSTIFRAVFSGFLMSACSHGILAIAVQLHKKGASAPAVIAFLLASPWANLPLTIVLFGFFGAKAFFLIFAALTIAVITGLLYLELEHRGWIESNPNAVSYDGDGSLWTEMGKKWRLGFKTTFVGVTRGAFSLADMVIWWMLVGMGLASLMGAYIPPDWFMKFMGPDFRGLLVTLAFATVLEVCSEGTAPLAFEIFRRTGGFGNALVFLLAGVATDYTEIGLLWTNVGRRTALWLPVITVPQIILFGMLANALF